MKPEPLIVQVRDADGFWCNAAEFTTADFRHAKLYAADWAAQHGVTTRLVRGASRDIVQTFAPPTAPSEPSEGPREYQ